MIKIISGKKYRKMNEEMDSLRLQNSESHKSLTELGGYAESLRLEVDLKNAEVKSRDARIELLKVQNESLARDRMSLQEDVSLKGAKIKRLEEKELLHKERIESFRIAAQSSNDVMIADRKRIEELETELKLAKSKSNTLSEQSLKDKETIQNLKNDIESCKENIAWKENKIMQLREKVEICKGKTAPTPPTTPTAEVVPTAVEAVKSLGTAIANAGKALNPVVGNVKRRYQKTGKFKKRK